MSLAGRITIPNSWLKACTNIQSTRNINIPFYSFVRAPSNQNVVTKFFSPDKITSHMPCHLLQAALPYSEAHQALLPTIAVSLCSEALRHTITLRKRFLRYSDKVACHLRQILLLLVALFLQISIYRLE